MPYELDGELLCLVQGFASGSVGAAGLPVEDGLLVLEHLCLQALESVRRGGRG